MNRAGTRWLSFVVVCALCLVGDANGQTASELASRAAQAMQSGDYAEAEKMFVRLESLAPGVPEVKSNLGLARYYGKKPDLARKDFVRALALNSNLFVSNFYLAKLDCEEGKYAEAIPFLRKAVKLQPQEPASRSLLADVLSRVGSRTEAIAQYRELLKQQPQNAGFLSGLAEVYLDQTRQSAQLLKQADPRFAALLKAESDSALSEWKSVAPERWQKALSVLPLFPGPRIRFADFLWSIDRFSESESPLQEELKIDPFSYKALFRLGQLKLRNGDLIAAAEYLEHSAQIRPEFFDPLPHLSIGPEHPEKYYAPFEPVDDNATFGRAFVMSELASKINPPANDSGWLSTALKRRTDLRLKIRSRLDVAKAPVGIEQRRTTGLKYLREKRLDEGLLLLLPIARTKTTDSELRIAVGRALAEADRPQELAASLGGAQASDAETLYHLVSSYKMLTADTIDKLVKNDPHAVELQKLNAESLADRNMFKEAGEQYRSALESRPDDPELYFGLGEAHFNQMQFDEAERAYGHAIELKPSDPAFYIMRASALVELHRAEEAMSLSRRALELNPKMLQAHVSLGRALALLGRDQEAAQELELAARTDTDGMLHYNLFKLYRNLGRSEEAKGALKTSNELRSRQPGGSESSAKPSVAENPVMKE